MPRRPASENARTSSNFRCPASHLRHAALVEKVATAEGLAAQPRQLQSVQADATTTSGRNHLGEEQEQNQGLVLVTNCSRLVIALVVLHKQSGRLEAWPSSWATVKASQLRSRAVIMGAPRSNGSDGEARVYATPRRTGGSLSPSLPFSAFVAFLRRSLATCFGFSDVA